MVDDGIVTSPPPAPASRPRRCWTESGAHFFVRESDGVFVCQICGHVKTLAGGDMP